MGLYLGIGSRKKGPSSSSGGGVGNVVVEKDIMFIDYDGTLLYSWNLDELEDMTALPPNPSHDGLIAQGWNWTLAELKTHSAKAIVGQCYKTDNGATRLYVLLETRRRIGVALSITDDPVSIDWGDGSAPEVAEESGIVDHTYSSGGRYIISLICESAYGSALEESEGRIIVDVLDDGTVSNYGSYCLERVEVGDNLDFGERMFSNASSLRAITTCDGIRIRASQFNAAKSLEAFVFPREFTISGSSIFQDTYKLSLMSIPPVAISLPTNFLYRSSIIDAIFPKASAFGTLSLGECSCMRHVDLGEATSLGTSAFLRAYGLDRIIIPSTVLTIGATSFQNMYRLKEIHFKSSEPPVVSNINAFDALPSDCVIYVPAGSLEAYTSSTNYPNSTIYTYREE